VYPGAHALTQPDKPALIMASTGKTITYAELNERSNPPRAMVVRHQVRLNPDAGSERYRLTFSL
jgi:fatty-acyl-CoA synthase